MNSSAGKSVCPIANHSTNREGIQPDGSPGTPADSSPASSSKSPASLRRSMASQSKVSGWLPYIVFHHLFDDRSQPGGVYRQRRTPDHVSTRRGTGPLSQSRRLNKHVQRVDEGPAIAGRHEQARYAVLNDFRNGVDVAADGWNDGSAGLLVHKAERLVSRGHREHIGAPP